MSNALNLEAEQLKEIAMVDLAYRLLTQTKKPTNYRELFNDLVEMKGMSKEQAMDIIAQVYTEINLDGRFICLGENMWGLKRWYLVETQEESAEGGFRGKFLLDDFDDDDDLDEEYDEVEETDLITTGDDEEDEDLDADFDEEEESDEEFSDEDDDEADSDEDDENLDM
ncbi:DNA-directed RNA polymerase subunit delta [Aneurinibacillus soli]|uniref:Probable DNA-directed RNA polymerase subunit delta n=1 Tax=Aneurinibacillus soli TaxID=1500254 RepID=A0A0U5ARK5_9BACL|nr:DNA-directed RNA polymerase subunit delta [Aneurinibacillus soli]PYE60078.1 DNA-directed RNA polymerase subunit delta [Aneurinibacillus soli]BAU26433.1 DNA-directed RNA polymerase subunit delta [Aneurinibacillus soli]